MDYTYVIDKKTVNPWPMCQYYFYIWSFILVPNQKCLSCSEIEDPRMCQNITTCGKDEVCI